MWTTQRRDCKVSCAPSTRMSMGHGVLKWTVAWSFVHMTAPVMRQALENPAGCGCAYAISFPFAPHNATPKEVIMREAPTPLQSGTATEKRCSRWNFVSGIILSIGNQGDGCYQILTCDEE
jgi:hypothetical protein